MIITYCQTSSYFSYSIRSVISEFNRTLFVISQPVYRTEVSDVTANEEGRIEIDSSVKEAINLSTSQKPTRNDTVKDDIRRRAQQLPMKIFKHKFTFKDSNFVSIIVIQTFRLICCHISVSISHLLPH